MKIFWKILVGVVIIAVLIPLAVVAFHEHEAVQSPVQHISINVPMTASSSQSLADATTTQPIVTGPVLRIGTTTISLEIADTIAKQEQGLSDRASLPEDHGMLFVFPKPGSVGFWMKDMNFSLDMIWLDANYKIITIAQNVSPKTYPEVFYPTQPAQYVVEVPAGFAKKYGLKVGTTLDIQR